MRKPIQITSSCCSDMNGSDIYFLTALCDDGSIWEYMQNTNSWWKLSDVPKDPPMQLPSDPLENKAGNDRWNELLNDNDPHAGTIKGTRCIIP